MSKHLTINIIYSEEDNKPIEDSKGWVSYFEKFLRMMLKQTMNSPFEINMFSEKGSPSMKPGYYIPILSPDFILSGSSLDALEALFNDSADKDIHEKIFPVFKSPLDYVDIPLKVRPLNAYIFYVNQENREKELFDFFSKEAEKSYWMKMVDLSFDIYETILKMHKSPADKDSKHDRRAIYLADTGQDLTGARNIIKRELIRHGYDVYPKSLLPNNLKELREAVANDLEKCQYSVHMIGAAYGNIPANSESSVMDLQNSMAAERADANRQDLGRLIWISPALKFASERQTAFIHNIKRDAKASAGAEVLQTSLEDFKNTLWEELLESGINKKLRNSFHHEEQVEPIVYLIYDEIDEKAAQKLKDPIEELGIKVITPAKKGELLELRNNHIDALKKMDAAIVLQESVNKQWVYMKLLDLLKAPGFGRSKPILGKLFKSSKVQGAEDEYAKRYEVEVDSEENTKKVLKFVKEVKANFEKSRLQMAGDR